eukprot:COSAG01_NODE_29776_length_630_cov_0.751412_1_plen_97_part_01
MPSAREGGTQREIGDAGQERVRAWWVAQVAPVNISDMSAASGSSPGEAPVGDEGLERQVKKEFGRPLCKNLIKLDQLMVVHLFSSRRRHTGFSGVTG